MMKLVTPPRLKKGDKIAAITLSAALPAKFPHKYAAGKKQFEDAFGIEIIEMTHTFADPDFIRRNPKARAEELNQAFADTSIKGIISSIGGDDSIRMLPYLDLDVIRRNPKVFMGYSDTTISHFACMKAGISSYYGPAIMAGFAENGGLHPYMEHSVRKALFEDQPIGKVLPNKMGWTAKQLPWSDPSNQKQKRPLQPNNEGVRLLQGRAKASGHLIGGCGEVLEFLKGTDFWPSRQEWYGAILFLETSEDAPPPIQVKWWLRNYAAQGILQSLSGIIFGRPGGENLSLEDHLAYDKAMLEVVHEECGLNYPIFSNMDFGHTDPMFVLPYGAKAIMDPQSVEFTIE